MSLQTLSISDRLMERSHSKHRVTDGEPLIQLAQRTTPNYPLDTRRSLAKADLHR